MLVSRIFVSWNQIANWLRQLEGLRGWRGVRCTSGLAVADHFDPAVP